VKAGESVHVMHAKDDPRSSVCEDEIIKTCSTLDCHPGTDPKLAGYNTHPSPDIKKNPVIFFATLFFYFLTTITIVFVMLMIILDIARRLFPNCSLLPLKRRDKK
jgi:hypothetical protein